MSQDMGLQAMYTPQNRYSMMKTILEKNGIKNVADFIPTHQHYHHST